MAYRILIVDDEAALQNMVKEILAQAGYDTASALTCAQALERFQAAPPDAVLLELLPQPASSVRTIATQSSAAINFLRMVFLLFVLSVIPSVPRGRC